MERYWIVQRPSRWINMASCPEEFLLPTGLYDLKDVNRYFLAKSEQNRNRMCTVLMNAQGSRRVSEGTTIHLTKIL